VCKVTFKSNGDEMLSVESFKKSNADEALSHDPLFKKVTLLKH
jgi:hypothetical protein